MITVNVKLTTELDGRILTWLACGKFSKYVPAKISGPPEECYPEEGGELEDYSCYLQSVEPDTNFRIRDINNARPSEETIEAALCEVYRSGNHD